MSSQRGFTVVELIIVVVIAAILAGIAAPNMAEFIKNNNRATRVNTFVTAVNFARSEAISRKVRVSLCRSGTADEPDFEDCDAGGNNFETGWIVFTDSNDDVRGVVDGADQVLRVFQPDMGGVATLVGNAALISYRSTGFRQDNAPLTFRYCDDRGDTAARAVIVTATGQSRLSRDTDNDGIEEDAAGNNLACP